ncbi:VMA21-like domain-containing protein [Xylariaceae sp. FL1019]|nr:VMA21-like domain-containing protein [Xylariaceae sp. FL1019]
MATRRIISSEKTILDKDDDDLKVTSSGQSSTAPAVPIDVILKLLAFTLAMVVVPIGSYFLTVKTIFRASQPLSKSSDWVQGNSTYAGILAAILANVVLVGYVVVAYNEDQSDQLEAEKKKTKEHQGKAE